MGRQRAKHIGNKVLINKAEAELKKVLSKGWSLHSISDSSYPRRLKHINSAPLVLYQRGSSDLNPKRTLAIVGSRKMSEEGAAFVSEFIQDLKPYNVRVISGLAYGVDCQAHKSCLDNEMETWGIVAHGLQMIYPHLHRALAEKMVDQGGSIITEFGTSVGPERENFPKRNRIIAGMSDAVLIVEAALKGGALITAQCANDFNRDVFAVPGKPGQTLKEGCNLLIKSHRANLIESVKDLEYVMRWEKEGTNNAQLKLEAYDQADRSILEQLMQEPQTKSLETLSLRCELSLAELSSRMVMLELSGLVKALPGNRYRLIS